MTEALQDAKITAMESDIKEIKSDVKCMPDVIVNKVNESVDLKLQLVTKEMEKQISDLEKKYQAKLIGLLLSIIAEGVGLVIAFLKG